MEIARRSILEAVEPRVGPAEGTKDFKDLIMFYPSFKGLALVADHFVKQDNGELY